MEKKIVNDFFIQGYIVAVSMSYSKNNIRVEREGEKQRESQGQTDRRTNI